MTGSSRHRVPRAWAGAWLVVALMLCAAPARAVDVPWKARPVTLVANEKPVAEFLRELVASQGLTAVVDPSITGTLSGKFVMSARILLDNICTTSGLTWYYDGNFVYIDPASETRSELLPVPRGQARTVLQGLARLGIGDSRFPLVASEREGGLLVTGPRRYVDLVRQATRLASQRAALADPSEVRLFPLKFSWAGDVRVQRGGREVVVPGVVSVLRSLFRPKPAGAIADGRGGLGLPPLAGPLRQLRLSTGEALSAPKLDGKGGMPATEPEDPLGAATAASDGELPQFQADPRLNAVWVRDLPERMARYETLIASMDRRPQLVEIEVTIMDISSDNFDALGVDWRLHGRHVDGQFGNGGNAALSWGGATSEAGQAGTRTPAGGVFTVSIGNDLRNYLLSRISALSRTGAASLVARPKVLTLNNTEAQLENLSQVNVRVDGFQDAGLFTLTAGTTLRMTPLIVEDAPRRSLMMSIDIVDGDLSAQAVDNIPIIRRRSITTQAMVDENASLLIAGFTSEETVNAVTGVPLLSQLPVIGRLFTHTEKTRASMERLYLLTPRLVTRPPADGAAAD